VTESKSLLNAYVLGLASLGRWAVGVVAPALVTAYVLKLVFETKIPQPEVRQR
jgi:hypothetical protein